MFRLLLICLLFASSVDATEVSKLDLKVRKVVCSPKLEGWRIQITNFGKDAVSLNQLQVKFWIREQPEVTKGKIFFNNKWVDSGIAYKIEASTPGPACQISSERVASTEISFQVLHDGKIGPGKKWESELFGIATSVPHDATSDFSAISDPKGNACEKDSKRFVSDPHFCLFVRGHLTQEFVSNDTRDRFTGHEPPCFTAEKPYDPRTDHGNPEVSNFYDVPQPQTGADIRSRAVGAMSQRDAANVFGLNSIQRQNEMLMARQRQQYQQRQVQAFIPASLNTSNATGWQYDNDGNTIQDPWGNSYSYDAEDHLVAVNGPVIGQVTYTVDGDGLVVVKVANGVTTTYLWDTNSITGIPQIVEEKQNGQLKVVYTWGRQLISQGRKDSGGAWHTSYYGYDARGDVRNLTDENGNITDTYDYDADGIMLTHNGTAENNYRFQGQYFDTDLRMYNLRARWYKTSIGRFWTGDPFEGELESPLSLHRYNYGSGDPINRIDPEGTFDIATSMASVNVQGILSSFPNVKFTNNLLNKNSRDFKLKIGFRELDTIAGKPYHHSFLVLERLSNPLYWGFFDSDTGISGSIQGSRSGSQGSSNASGTSMQRPGIQDNSVYGHLVGLRGPYDASARADYLIPPARWQDVSAPGYLSFDGIKSQFDSTMMLVEAMNINYNPVSTNSNASARTMLDSIGLHGIQPQMWAPGWNTNLY